MLGLNLTMAAIVLAYGGRVVPPMTGPAIAPEAPPAPAKQWDRALPFMAQRVIDRGIDLPNPYDLGFSLYLGSEDRNLSSLRVGFNGNAPIDASFVGFPNSHINPQSGQFQAGAWIFPFLNAYLIGGYTRGTGKIDIAIDGAGLMDTLGIPGCSLPPAARPALCSQAITGVAHADYHGPTYGLGITTAGMYKGVFFSLPITYVISHPTISDTPAKTWNVAPRAGYNQRLEGGGMLTWYAGGTYLKSDMNITGTFDIPTAGTVIGRDTTMSYSIHVEPKDRWNYLAGANWTISRNFGVLAEVGFGTSRSDLLFAAFYRF